MLSEDEIRAKLADIDARLAPLEAVLPPESDDPRLVQLNAIWVTLSWVLGSVPAL